MSMKISEIAEEVGVQICWLSADEIRRVANSGAISQERAEILLVELKTTDGFWQNPKFGSTTIDCP